jgi:triosephosphate isomerase
LKELRRKGATLKANIRVPFFEVGVKNYIFGDSVLELALAAEEASKKFDIDVIFIAPYTEIRRISEQTKHILVFAPYMDILRPGRGMADVLPEALKAAGAKGVVVNHCERPMTLTAIKKTIDRANELDMLTFACADTLAESQAIAHLHPDIINPEPTELIGTGNTSDLSFVMESIRLIKSIAPTIFVEQAAGITTGKQVYDLIYAGSEATGSSSGILKSKNPCSTLTDMVENTRKAWDDLQNVKFRR